MSRPPLTVKSVVLDRKRFPSRGAAVSWLRRNGFTGLHLETNEHSFRGVQRATADFLPAIPGFRDGRQFTGKHITGGVSFVFGRLRDGALDNPATIE